MKDYIRQESGCSKQIVTTTYDWNYFQNLCAIGIHVSDEIRASEEELSNFREFVKDEDAYPNGIQFKRQRGILISVEMIDDRIR